MHTKRMQGMKSEKKLDRERDLEEKRKKILENDFTMKDYFAMLLAAIAVIGPVILVFFGILYLVSLLFV